MGSDPGPFLSTIILASAGLVAIIGGLLVARRRAADARYNLLACEARGFLNDSDVLDAIGQGISDPEALRRLEDCPLSDQELRPFVAEVGRGILTSVL